MLDREQIREQPNVELDDRLRSVPGFSLFRRSSSLVANPTTQGVTLRGLGSSGASRSLVLWDGIPVNDPFGGWVYWTRLPPDEIEQVEISRGASTSLFGDRAMAGVVSVFSRPVEPPHVSLAYEGGNYDTQMATAAGSMVWGRFGLSGTGRGLKTDGYYIVPPDVRGTVDTPAGVEAAAGDVRVDYLGGSQNLFVKFDLLAEDRANGTQLTHNSTSLGNIGVHYAGNWNRETFSLLAYHTEEQYHATFSSVSADRDSERLTSYQTVPSQAAGGAALWNHAGGWWNLVGGADTQWVEGWSTDRLVPAGVRIGGGTQWQEGTFLQANVSHGAWRLFGGGRYQFTGQGGRTFFSPSGGLEYGKGRIRARGSVYRAFRAPTLNELYRQFRAGNTVTLANAALIPETVFGAEAGVDISGETRRLSITAYRHSLNNLITNVTLSSTANTIIRQRQNAGEALVLGVEANFRQRWKAFTAEAAYLYADAQYVSGPRIPEVPRNQGSALVSWSAKWLAVSAGIRAYSSQYDDDLNQYLLPGYTTLMAVARVPIGKGFSASAAFENLLDHTYLVAFTPTPNTGQPYMWRLGLRWH